MESVMRFHEVRRHQMSAEQMSAEAKKATDPVVKAAYETIASAHLSTFKTLSLEFNIYASTLIGEQNPGTR